MGSDGYGERVPGPPHTPARPITAEEVQAFWRDGVVVLRGVLQAEWIEHLVPAVERALAGEATADLSALAGPPEGTPRFRAGVDHWLADDDMAAFALDSPLPAIAAVLLGGDHVWLWEDSVLVKPPGTREETRFHQDLPYFQLEGDRLTTFWCPLDPVTEATGSLRFVRGSHRWGAEFRPNLFVIDDPIPGTEGDPVPAIDPDDPAVLCADLVPGDITVHHARTLHGAGPNTSTEAWRRAVSVRYCGDGVRVRHRPGVPVADRHRGLADGAALSELSEPLPQAWPRRPGEG